jgi:adenylate cyclase
MRTERVDFFERRLVALLAADASEYCRLMSQDDELTLSRLLSYRQILEKLIAARSGRMFGAAGDSWMAEFRSAVDAVQCAVDCQRAIECRNEEIPAEKRIRFRIGIHWGHAIAECGNLFGDAVNIAARLQQLCRPGYLVISDTVFQQVQGKVDDLSFRPMGVQRLRNIPKDISAFTTDAKDETSAREPRQIPSSVDISKPAPDFDDKPAIAVLPFKTLGSQSDGGDLGDGFAEELVNGLSNVRWFAVVSRCSSFLFRNQDLDAAAIGRATGATYLVTGSVRLSGDELSLIVHLVDAGSGRNLWSQKYEVELDKLPDQQEEIIASIVSVLDAEVGRAESLRLRARKAEDLDSWGLARRGISHLWRFTREDAVASRKLLEEALRLDPGSSEARIQLAWWHFWDVWTKQRNRRGFYECGRLAREAAAIDPRDARAHLLIGISLMMTEQPKQARWHFRESIDLNPSLPTAHGCLGSSYILGGEPEKGIEALLFSIRLNPRDPFAFNFLGESAVGFHMLENWSKACEFAERSLQARPNFWYARAVCVASLARGGRTDEACKMADRLLADSAAERIAWVPFTDKKWNQYLLDGLKLAGCKLL